MIHILEATIKYLFDEYLLKYRNLEITDSTHFITSQRMHFRKSLPLSISKFLQENFKIWSRI